MRKQKINWFFSTSGSCSVALPSLSGEEAQHHVAPVWRSDQPCPRGSTYNAAGGLGPGRKACFL